MAREWTVMCKECRRTFGYSDSSYNEGRVRGHSRPERCVECRQKHNRETALMGMAYFDLKPRKGANTENIQSGSLGALWHPKREHQVEQHVSAFDPNKFGVTDDDIRALFHWFDDPMHQVAVVVGPTGSGKSTVLPFRLISPPKGLKEDMFTRNGQIVVTQPRIQATRNIPAFVARDLLGSNVGSGYDIGFRYSNHPYSDWRNRLVYVTDGTLINWIVNGQIANLSVIMIDEAHERSLNIDLILGMLKKLLPRYPHLKLIVASATIDADLFVNYFGRERTGLIEFKGKRKFNVVTHFAKGNEKLAYDSIPRLRKVVAEAMAAKVVMLLEGMVAGKKEPGDVLGFLQGVAPINDAVEHIREELQRHDKLKDTVDVYPLYTTLPQEEQDKALKEKPDPDRRRVVITTNVAETSLTVEGIVYVVDSGLINQDQWSPQSQTKRVVPVLHSQAGCKQRWGRAGRVRDGEAYCLYTKKQFTGLFPEYTVPQIQRSALEQIVLSAKAAGIDDILGFDWIEEPPLEELTRSTSTLQKKGALDANGDLTEHGLEIQAFAEEPALANLMVLADRYACAVEMATILAIIKTGRLTTLLHWNQDWDGITKSAVAKIHESLRMGCLDDVEYCLKLYAAWSEAEYADDDEMPDWVFREVWTDNIPVLSPELRAALGPEASGELTTAAALAGSFEDVLSILRGFEVEDIAGSWSEVVQEAMVDARVRARAEAGRVTWARAHFVSHSIMRDKVETARETLLDALSGHKKEDEGRPIDFELLDRLRLIMACGLREQIYEPDEMSRHGKNEQGTQVYHRHAMEGDSEDREGRTMPVHINEDSVCYGLAPSAFACGRQQAVKRRLSPNNPAALVLYVSYLSLIEKDWLKWIDSWHPIETSALAFGSFIARKTRDRETGEVRRRQNFERIFLDQAFRLGSRYKCCVKQGGVELPEVELGDHVAEARMIVEGFVSEQDSVSGGETAIVRAKRGMGEITDTVLSTMKPPVLNPEEDEAPPWADLADDSYEVDGERWGESADSEEIDANGEKHDEQYGRVRLKTLNGSFNPTCRLRVSGELFESGEELTAEIIGYDYSNIGQPVILFKPVAADDPFELFAERHDVGDKISVIAVEYDALPNEASVSLAVEEPKTGMRTIIEADSVSFVGLNSCVETIPLGSSLKAVIEEINSDRSVVRLSLLPVVEEHLNEAIDASRREGDRYEVRGSVRHSHLSQRKVFLSLEWSDANAGVVHGVTAGGRGLFKKPAMYQEGERCWMHVWFSDQPVHTALPNLPDGVGAGLTANSEFKSLTWREGILYFAGRMPYSLQIELMSMSEDRDYRRAVGKLYRFSNRLMAKTFDKREYRLRQYSVGDKVEGRVTDVKEFGAIVQLTDGSSGLIHKSNMPGRVVSARDVFSIDDEIAATVQKVNSKKKRLDLSMLSVGSHPMDSYPVGAIVRGKINGIKEYGVFVYFGSGVTGLIHKSEMEGPFTGETQDEYQEGKEVEVVVIGVESRESRKLKLSMRGMSDPMDQYIVGKRVQGKINAIKEYGVFVNFGFGVTGLIHKSEIIENVVEGVRNELQEGEEVEVIVIGIKSKQERKLALSMKWAESPTDDEGDSALHNA